MTKAPTATNTNTRPEFVKDEHLRYLDTLRESGAVNMFGAAPRLVDAFELDKRTARQILKFWMESFK